MMEEIRRIRMGLLLGDRNGGAKESGSAKKDRIALDKKCGLSTNDHANVWRTSSSRSSSATAPDRVEETRIHNAKDELLMEEEKEKLARQLEDDSDSDDNNDEDSDEGVSSVVDVDEGTEPGIASEYYIIPNQCYIYLLFPFYKKM
jgi:hypothetical protein